MRGKAWPSVYNRELSDITSLRHSERMARRLYSCYGSFERGRMDLWLLKPGHKFRTRDGAGARRAG